MAGFFDKLLSMFKPKPKKEEMLHSSMICKGWYQVNEMRLMADSHTDAIKKYKFIRGEE